MSGNCLKIIAAIFMFIDHFGVILMPDSIALRVLGRISFPIFAFMISQGCYHTKNKLRYLLSVFSLAVLCQIVYFIFDGSTDFGILITFSLSIILIFAMQNFKKSLFAYKQEISSCITDGLFFALLIAFIFAFCKTFNVDYGFWGIVAPLFACIFKQEKGVENDMLKKLDCLSVNLLTFAIGLLILSLNLGGIQFYSLFAVPLLMLYNGKRGKWNMKWFFYIFYPLHFLLLYGISLLIV